MSHVKIAVIFENRGQRDRQGSKRSTGVKEIDRGQRDRQGVKEIDRGQRDRQGVQEIDRVKEIDRG